jgi:hypothetical protein
LQRRRNYDDEVQYFERVHPKGAPEWAYIEQPDLMYDTGAEESRELYEEADDEDVIEVLHDSQASQASNQ